MRPPSPSRPTLPILFGLLLVADAIILILAANVRYGGSDAAGNGMANGLHAAAVLAAGIGIGLIALLFLVIRHRIARIILTVALATATFGLLGLLE